MNHLSQEEKAAILCYNRIARFIDGYNPYEELLKLLKNFSDQEKLQKEGLVVNYNNLKQNIIYNNSIGLILYGSIAKQNKLLSIYINKKCEKIELYTKNVCLSLLNDYFEKEEIKKFCALTPNFKIYYNNI